MNYLAIFLSGLATYASAASDGGGYETYLGEWCVERIDKYEGGLTEATKANTWIGSKLLLSRSIVQSRLFVIENPVLRHSIEKVETEEGVVGPRNSLFYGVFLDRTTIEKISVFETSSDEYAYVEFEVVNKGKYSRYLTAMFLFTPEIAHNKALQPDSDLLPIKRALIFG